MDDLKRTTLAAAASSLVLVGGLLLFVDNEVRQPRVGIGLLVTYVSILLVAYATVHLWIRCAKRYIDRAIDRKIGTSRRE